MGLTEGVFINYIDDDGQLNWSVLGLNEGLWPWKTVQLNLFSAGALNRSVEHDVIMYNTIGVYTFLFANQKAGDKNGNYPNTTYFFPTD